MIDALSPVRGVTQLVHFRWAPGIAFGILQIGSTVTLAIVRVGEHAAWIAVAPPFVNLSSLTAGCVKWMLMLGATLHSTTTCLGARLPWTPLSPMATKCC